MARPDRSVHARLLLCTALGGLAAAPALALPGAPANIATNSGGGAPVFTNPNAATLDIKLNAPRTILQYPSFSVASQETVNLRFDTRSDLAVIHATQGAINIDGRLASFVNGAYGGNVWLLSAAGVLFGQNARVDVGGLLASTSVPSDLLSATGPVLTPTALSFDFGDGAGLVSIAAGAQINGYGGTLAFIAPSVRTANGATVAGDANTAVLYGGAQRYTVRFVREAGDDLDLLDFEVPGLTAGSVEAMPLMLAGSTTGGNVYVASVSRADAVRAVLDAQGSIGATNAGLEGGSIVLTAGGGIAGRAAAPLLAGGIPHDLTAASLSTDGSILAQSTGDTRVGDAAAKFDLQVLAANGLAQIGSAHVGQDFRLSGRTVSLGNLGPYVENVGCGNDCGYGGGYGGDTFAALLVDPGTGIFPTRDAVISATAGGFSYDQPIDVTRDVRVTTAGDVVLAGVTAGQDIVISGASVDVGTQDAARDLSLTSTVDYVVGFDGLTGGRDVLLDAKTELVVAATDAGRDLTLVSRTGSISVDAATAGDDLRAAAAAGGVDIGSASADGSGPDTEGDGGNIVLTGSSLTLSSAYALTDIVLTADESIAAGLDGNTVEAGRDLILSAKAAEFGALVAGRDLSVTVTDADLNPDLLGGATPLTAGRDLILTASGAILAGALNAPRDLILTGGTIEVGALTAGNDIALTSTADYIVALDGVDAGRDIGFDAKTELVVGGVTAGRDLTAVSRTGSISVDAARAGDDIRATATGGGVDFGGARAEGTAADSEGDGANIVLAGASITLSDGYALTDVLLTASETVAAGLNEGSVRAGRDIIITGTGLEFETLDAGRDLSLTATDGNLDGALLDGASLTAGRNLSLTAAGNISAFSLFAPNDLILDGATIDVEFASAGHDLNALARSGLARIGSAAVGNDVLITGQSVELGHLQGYSSGDGYGGGGDGYGGGYGYGYGGGGIAPPPRDVILIATAGTILGPDLTVTRDIRAIATGAITLGGLDAGRDVVLTGASLDTSGIAAGRDVLLTATASDIAAGDIAAIRDLTLDASGALSFGSATAGRDLVLAGATVDGEDATAGRDATATARTGGLTLGRVTAGDDVRLSGATIDIEAVHANGLGEDTEADGSNIVATGGTITLEQAQAATDLLVTGSGVVTIGIGTGGVNVGQIGGSDEDYYGKAGNDIVLIGTSLLLGPLDAGRDVRLTATADGIDGRAAINGGRDVLATAAGPVSVQAVTAGRDLALTGTSLSNGALSSGRDLLLTATVAGIDAGDISAVRDLTLDAAGALTVGTTGAGRNLVLAGSSVTGGAATAGGDVTATARTGALMLGTISAGNDILLTATGNLSAGGATAARDILLVGGMLAVSTLDAGRDLGLTATAGSFTGPATLTAIRDLRVDALGVTLGNASAGRDLTVDGHAGTLAYTRLDAGHDMSLTAATVQGGAAVAVRDLSVLATTGISGSLFQAGGNLSLDPNEPINATTVIAGGAATLVGSAITIATLQVGGTTSAVATGGGIAVDSFTGHDAVFIATGKIDFGDATGGAVRIAGGDLDVRRSLVASSLVVETPGRLVLGGTAAPGETGFRLAAADIARLRVSGIVSFYAGLTTQAGEGTPPGGDLIVQDFAYDPANLPRLALFADRGHVVDVQGIVAPSDVGGSLQIGDANPEGRFRPASIYVSGSLGTAELIVNCFGRVVPANSLSLYTVGDVIFGDAAFRAAVQGTAAGAIDIFAGVPATPPRTDDHLFAVTTRLIVQANGKVVSQNSASLTGAYVGIVLIGTGATGPIIDIGTAAAADLSGSLIDSLGFLRSGPLVARAAELGPGGVNGAIFRFNGCIVGGGICSAGGDLDTPSQALRVEDYQPPRPIDLTDSPLTTVLVVDNVVGKSDKLTVIDDSNGIVLQHSVTVLDAADPNAPPSDSCTVVPGSDGNKPTCPTPGPR